MFQVLKCILRKNYNTLDHSFWLNRCFFCFQFIICCCKGQCSNQCVIENEAAGGGPGYKWPDLQIPKALSVICLIPLRTSHSNHCSCIYVKGNSSGIAQPRFHFGHTHSYKDQRHFQFLYILHVLHANLVTPKGICMRKLYLKQLMLNAVLYATIWSLITPLIN